MTIDMYVPLIHVIDATVPNALRLVQTVNNAVSDFNARGDVLDYGQAASDTPPVPVPPAPQQLFPMGKGIFIWQLSKTAGGDPVKAAAAAHAAGLSWVALKVSDGATALGGLEGWVSAFRAQGIRLWGWGYVYLRDPAGEAKTAAERVGTLGLDGFLIDAEGEVGAAAPAAVGAYCGTLQEQMAGRPVGLCSYRFPKLHQEVAWQTILGICTFHAPQMYPLGNVDPAGFGKQLTESVSELVGLKGLPVIPIGPLFNWTPAATAANPKPATWGPSVPQIQDFIATVEKLKLPGYGWYVWESAEQHADWWLAMASAAVG